MNFIRIGDIRINLDNVLYVREEQIARPMLEVTIPFGGGLRLRFRGKEAAELLRFIDVRAINRPPMHTEEEEVARAGKLKYNE